MKQLEELLAGGDLRSIGKNNAVVSKIKSQHDFDKLFEYLYHKDRRIVMRAADAIEKISTDNPQYLIKYKDDIFQLCKTATNKELKWHLALLLPRCSSDNTEFSKIWEILLMWTMDKKNSRIVRVNSLQGLFEILKHRREFAGNFRLILAELQKENIPSINARIRNLQRALDLNF